MAAKKKPARVCVKFDDGAKFCTTRQRFLEDNSEDTRTANKVRKLKVGESYRDSVDGISIKRTR